MELNMIATGIKLIGTAVKSLTISNSIVDVEKNAKRNLGMNINEPEFQKEDLVWFAKMTIDFEIEIIQDPDEKCLIKMSMEGAFLSDENVDLESFKSLVSVNGAAALIGIARGKIEALTAGIFNDGKIVIPFVNVIDYYKSLSD